MFAVPENTVTPPADVTTLPDVSADPVRHASRPSAAHPVRLARELAADRTHWAHLLRYDPDQRWARRFLVTDDYEVWLLSWLPGQGAEPHHHGGATGAFTVVNGTISESVLRSGSEAVHVLGPGQSRVFGPDYVHQMRNDGADPAVTIHVYSPERRMGR